MSPRRLLVIDDSPLVRKVVEASLAATRDWEVAIAASGREGIEQASAEPPDAILLDVKMPEMDGPATLAALRAGGPTRAVPVLLMTAEDRAEELERLRALHPAGIVGKPFDPGALAGQIGDLLGWDA